MAEHIVINGKYRCTKNISKRGPAYRYLHHIKTRCRRASSCFLFEKTAKDICPTYAAEYLLAPAFSKYYLNQLDIEVCRYLKKELQLTGKDLRFAAYLLVTYAIEVRADELYPVYQDALDNAESKVNVKSIILEEEGHLEEMISQLKKFSPDWELHAQKAVAFESRLFGEWLNELAMELNLNYV